MKTNYGPVEVAIDATQQQITLTLKRYAQPLSDRVLQGLRKWAVDVALADHPGFEVVDNTGLN